MMTSVKQKRDRPVARSTTLSKQEKNALDAEVRLVAYKLCYCWEYFVEYIVHICALKCVL